MNRITLALALSLTVLTASAQNKKVDYTFTEASDLTMVGKLMPDTPNPYHRVDTVKFKGFTKSENRQVRMSAGLAVAFRTDSKIITIKTKYEDRSFPVNTGGLSARGYDLYIRNNGEWLWAASAVAKDNKPDENVTLIKDMDGTMHECLLYLPVFSEESSIKIGTEKNASIEAIDNPFRHIRFKFHARNQHFQGGYVLPGPVEPYDRTPVPQSWMRRQQQVADLLC